MQLNFRFNYLLFFGSLICSAFVYAQEQISKKYYVEVSDKQYPLQFINDEGKPDGLLIDFWRVFAQKNELEIDFLVIENKNSQPVKQLTEKSATQLRSQFISLKKYNEQPELAQQQSFHFDKHFFININRELSNVATVTDLLPYAIGVIEGSSDSYFLTNNYPDLTLKKYLSDDALYKAVFNNELVAFANFSKNNLSLLEQTELSTLFPLHKKITYSPLLINITASIPLNTYEKIAKEDYLPITEKWLGKVDKRERLFITYNQQKPPFIQISSKGNAEGLLVDLWRYWSDYTGVDVDFIHTSKSQAIAKFSQNMADVNISFADEALNENITPVYRLYQSNVHFFVSDKFNDVNHVDDLSGFKIAVASNFSYLSVLENKYPNINFLKYENLADALMPAQSKIIDGVIGEVQSVLSLLEQAKLSHQYFIINGQAEKISFHALVSIDKEALTETIINGFGQLPAQRLIELEKKWLVRKQYSFFEKQAQRIRLSLQQKQWLADHPTIKVGMTTNWSPMEFINKYGDFSGINPDIFTLISERIGTQFTFVPYDNWQSLMNAAKNKEIDLLASISNTPEREAYLNFSEPYWNMPWGLLHPVSGGNKAKLSDFNKQKVAILSGLHIIDVIKKSHPLIELVEVDALDDGYKLLQKGGVAALVTSLAPASELLKRESLITMGLSVLDNLTVDAEHIGVRNDWPELLVLVNQALLTINELEKQEVIDKWFNVNIKTGFEKNVVIKVAIQIGVFIIIVIAVIIFWNRRLYHEIKRRKALEIKMKHMATHDELTGLANRTLLTERINTAINFHKRRKLTLAVLFIDLDGFKHVNDNYGHDVGDELLVKLTERLQGCVRESDTVARFGGDEFVLFITGLSDKREAAFIAEKALKVIRRPVELSATTVAVSCSIGIASFPEDGDSDTELLKVADTLMYRVKAHGKNHYLFN